MSNREITYIINNLAELHNLAKNIAKTVKIGTAITLEGTLGAGKTELVRSIINHLSSAPVNVPSPTFNIVNTYNCTGGLKVWHYDLYRIKHESELEELAFDEAFAEVAFIEWAEIAKHLLPNNTINIKMDIIENDKRLVTINYNREGNV